VEHSLGNFVFDSGFKDIKDSRSINKLVSKCMIDS